MWQRAIRVRCPDVEASAICRNLQGSTEFQLWATERTGWKSAELASQACLQQRAYRPWASIFEGAASSKSLFSGANSSEGDLARGRSSFSTGSFDRIGAGALDPATATLVSR